MTRAVILVEQGFQDEEFVYPYYRMLEEGWQVTVIGPECKGKYGVPARPSSHDLQFGPLDVVVIPGGYECPDRLRMKPDILELVRVSFRADKVVAAICHGPWVLISAGVVSGRQCTGYASLKDDLINAGGIYKKDMPAVVDGNLVTSDHYRNLGSFMRAVIDTHNKRHEWKESPVVI